MPKYIANEYLLHDGKIVQTGEEVELEAKQAARLGDKVTPVPGEKEPKKETKAKKESK